MPGPAAASNNHAVVYQRLSSAKFDARKAAIAELLDACIDRQCDVAYALKRLIRGLSSSARSARQGFALALSAVLQLGPTIITDDALLYAVKQHMPRQAPNQNRQDRKDIIIGTESRVAHCHRMARSHFVQADAF